MITHNDIWRFLMAAVDLKSDTLAPNERFFTAASLFEGGFSIDWLQEICELKVSQILSALDHGLDRGILKKEGADRYTFKTDTARKKYTSLLTTEEKEGLGKSIATILMRETNFDNDSLELIARQLLTTASDENDCLWLIKAADHSQGKYHYDQALQCYMRAIRVLNTLKGKAADDLFIQAAIGYSKISETGADSQDVKRALGQAIVRAESGGNKAQVALLEMNMAKTEWMLWEEDAAFTHFNRGWALAQEVNDPRLMQSATNFSTFFLYWQGRYKETVQHYEKYLPEIEKYPRGQFPMMAAWVVGSAYAVTGQLTQGIGMMDAVYTHCKNQGDEFGAITMGIGIGSHLIHLGRTDEAMEYLLEAKAYNKHAPHQMFLMSMLIYLAFGYYLKKDKNKAESHLSEFLQASQRSKMSWNYFPPLLELCWAMEQGFLSRIGDLSLEKEIDKAISSKNVFLKGSGYHYKALLMQHRGASDDKTIQTLMRSIRWLKEAGDQNELARVEIALAGLHLKQGREEKTREIMKSIAGYMNNLPHLHVPESLRPMVKEHRIDRNLLREILKLADEMVTIRDFRKAARTIISKANQITGAERGAIFYLEGEGSSQKLVLRAAKNLARDDIDRPEFSESMKMIRETVETGEGRIMSAPSDSSPSGRSGDVIRGCSCVPMRLRGEIVGVMYNDNRFFGSAFKEVDLEIFNYFAVLSAIAMDNARAYDEITELNGKLLNEKQYYEEQHLEDYKFEEIIGKSTAIRQLISKLNQVSETDATVLVLGETGVGKELVARAIHRLSSRKDKPFIRVNTSALPESLISSELFGHEKGAFTGATGRHIGRFELAHTGTLFLDEISDIPLEVQVRLLRVLQNKEFERVGGKETLRSDFRLVTAANQSLKVAVQEKRFREDLYYRLNVFPIYVPPLRERREDIPLLVQFFLEIHSTKTGKETIQVSEADMKKLRAYHWPGNVRELENVVERGAILTKGIRFQMPELQEGEQMGSSRIQAVSYEENERRHLVWALEETGGKIYGKGGAADLLKLHPSTLYSKMDKLSISKP